MDPPNVTVRPATAGDLRALGRLGALLVRTHHELDPLRFIAPSAGAERGYAAYLGGQLEDRGSVILVAEVGGEVLGYSYASIEGRDWMALRGPAGVLHDLVVNPEHRAGGIGSLLLEATLAELAARGAPRVTLSTAERNLPAQRLFSRAGFRRTMIEMTRELPADGPR